MTFNSETLTLTNSTHLWLEIPEAEQTKIWQQSQAFSTNNRRWIAYLNRLSLNAFLPWVREEHDNSATAFPNVKALPSIWEVVNGTGISLGNLRMVLIPTEDLDLSELRVSSRMGGYSQLECGLLSGSASQFRRGLHSDLGVYYPGAT